MDMAQAECSHIAAQDVKCWIIIHYASKVIGFPVVVKRSPGDREHTVSRLKPCANVSQ